MNISWAQQSPEGPNEAPVILRLVRLTQAAFDIKIRV